MSIVEVEHGRVVFELQPAEWMYNPIGSVHGGIAATILDSCMGCAVHTTLPAGVGYTTTDLQVRYLGAMSARDTGSVHAEGRVVHVGGRIAAAEGRVFAVDEPERTHRARDDGLPDHALRRHATMRPRRGGQPFGARCVWICPSVSAAASRPLRRLRRARPSRRRRRPSPVRTGAPRCARGTFEGREVTVPHVANPAVPGTAGGEGRVPRRRPASTARRSRREAGTYVLRFESVGSRAEVFVDGKPAGAHQRAYEPFEVPLRLEAGTARGRGARGLALACGADAPGAAPHVVQLGRHQPRGHAAPRRRQRDHGRRADDQAARRRRAGSARLAVRVRNSTRCRAPGPGRRAARAARARAGLRRRRGGARLRRGAHAASARSSSRARTSGVPATAPSTRCRSWSRSRAATARGSGCASCAGATASLRINGRRTVLRGASLHEDVPGRGDALTRRRHAPRGGAAARDRRQRDARAAPAGARAARAPGSRRHRGLAADRPGRLARQVRDQHAASCSRRPATTSARTCAPTGCTRRSSPGRWPARSPATARPARRAFIDAAARVLHAADPDRGVGVDVWTDHLPDRPGLLYRSLDAIGVTSYLGWYEHPRATPAQQARAAARARPRPAQPLPGQGGARRRARRRRASPDAHRPRAAATTRRRCSTPSCAGCGERPGLDGAFVWVLRDFAINPAFRGGTATRLFPDLHARRRAQPEGPVRLRRARQARGRGRAPRAQRSLTYDSATGRSNSVESTTWVCVRPTPSASRMRSSVSSR